MNAPKKSHPALIIMRRELAAYFASPVAYIVLGLFLIVSVLWPPCIPLSRNWGNRSKSCLEFFPTWR